MKAGLAQAVKPQKIMQHTHGIIQKLFDCWAGQVAHLLLLKSSMAQCIFRLFPTCKKFSK